MSKIGIYRVQLRRALSLRLLLVSFMIAGLHGIAGSGFLRDIAQSGVWYGLTMGTSTGMNYFSFYIMPTLVFSYTLATEWDEHASDYWMIRSGVSNYFLSKLVVCAISGFLVLFLSLVWFVAIAGLFGPLYTGAGSADTYSGLIERGYVARGYLLYMVDKSLSGAIVAVIGLCASVFVMAPYTAVVAPLAFTLTWSRLVFEWDLPQVLSPSFWMNDVSNVSSAGKAVTYKLLVTLALIAVLGLISLIRMRRRVKHATA